MIVLITGASSGFGAEMARKFVSHGHLVIAAARRTDRLSALAAELGKNLLPIELDVTSKTSIDHALATLPTDWQTIDVLINNAGLALGLEAAHEAHLGLSKSQRRQNCDPCPRKQARHLLSPSVVARSTQRCYFEVA
jgi:NADP-dependent 3-hydroxy acid dehydrogenase YdfG